MQNRYWEFKNSKQMYDLLGGQKFGRTLKEIIPAMRAYKKAEANKIALLLQIEKSHTVLEIGVGSGLIAKYMAPRSHRFYGCDISRDFINQAKLECRTLKNTSFHHTKSGQLDFLQTSSLDCVYASGVFVHLNLYEIFAYFEEISRVLKEGGALAANVAHEGLFTDDFFRMSKRYKQNEGKGVFIHWNSMAAIQTLARKVGLHFLPSETKYLLFIKKTRRSARS